MKTLLALLISSSVALSATQLHIPLEGQYYVNHKEIKLKISKLNKELNGLGLAGLPEVVVIAENPKPFFKVIEKRIEAANKALNREMTFNLTHYGYIYELDICYTGSMNGVPEIIENARGNFFNADQGILAIAYGGRKVINDEAFKSKEGLKERFDVHYEGNFKAINTWLNYKSSNDKVLVMSDYGPQGDGTELEVTWIPPCE